MRGRNRNKGPNPLTRTYESNGPDVKIRGTAQHVADKYAQLARDAQASGDPVAAENYLQHAEHYYRLIAAVQEQYRQQYGIPQRPFDEDGDEGDEDAAPGPYDRFERGSGPQPGGGEYGEAGPQSQPYEARPEGERPPRFDRGDRYDRGERFDRGERQENRGPRNERVDRGDRGEGRDRFPRQDRPPRQDFQRPDGPRSEGPRDEGPGRPDFRRERPRDRDEGGREPPAGLPAFLTTPVRTPIAVDDAANEAAGNGPAEGFDPAASAGPDVNGADLNGGPHGLRGRRRRRPRYEGPGAGSEGSDAPPEGSDTPPVD